jgi:hypothetical protein
MGHVVADYDSDNEESKWERVKNIFRRRNKKSDMTKSRRQGPSVARYKVGDVVHTDNWSTKLKVKAVEKDGDSWKYKLTMIDDGKDYNQGDWQKEDTLHPDY